MKKIDKWLDKINPAILFGVSAIPFFISGICFFQLDGDPRDWVYTVLGSFFSVVTIYLWVKIYNNVNG